MRSVCEEPMWPEEAQIAEIYSDTRLCSVVMTTTDPTGTGGVVTSINIEASKHKRALG